MKTKEEILRTLEQLKKEIKVVEINGERPIDEIQNDLIKWINSTQKQNQK